MHHCKHCQSHAACLEQVPIFSSLNKGEKAELVEISSSRSFKKGDSIYRAGDKGGTLFVIYTGRVKLFRLNAAGREQVLRMVGPGEFMGELSLFSSLPLSDYATALEETTMCILDGGRLKELMAKYPSIAFKTMDELSRRLEEAENIIEDISLSSVSKRVSSALLEMSQGKREIILPMTKGDLASKLGMTQETLSRRLSTLQEDGVIQLKGHRIILIKDLEMLQEISLSE